MHVHNGVLTKIPNGQNSPWLNLVGVEVEIREEAFGTG